MAQTVLRSRHVLKVSASLILPSRAGLRMRDGERAGAPQIWAARCWRSLQRGLCVRARDPLFLVAGSVRPPRDSSVGGARASLLHRFISDEERGFNKRLSSCSSSQQVMCLLRSSPPLSGAAAASVLHRLADLERDGAGGPRDPEPPLSDSALDEMCGRLEQDSAELEDEVVVKALLGCARLQMDPWSRPVARLVTEIQVHLDSGHLGVRALCSLALALFALRGPDCDVLAQVMRQLQDKDPGNWSTEELSTVYNMLAEGAGQDGRYQDLLNQMNSHALGLASRMDPAAVSETLGALVALGQMQALPLAIAMCKQAVRHIPNFTDAQLATVLSALTRYGHGDRFLTEALEHHVPKVAFTAHPETVTGAMQYFAQRRILSPALFDAVAEGFVYRADEYTTGQVTRQMTALAALGYVPQEAGRFFRKVELVLNSRFSHFQPRALLELLHACTLLRRYPLNYVSRVFSPYFLQQLQDEGRRMDQTVLAQLTQLYMTMKLECPSYDGPRLLPKLRVKSFLSAGQSVETQVDLQLLNAVKSSLVDLLGARSYFASRVLTPYCYTLDVQIKLDEDGYILPASHVEEVFKWVAVCIDGPNRFAANSQQLLGKEAIKQRHLRILGYEVVQIPYYEFETMKSKEEVVKYLHKKIFPQSFRLSW
ncbi:FAST kinase domain-containing protein 3, mitochondrial [Brachyhypopomus gauderio]|uniref:FAST kinase domain-containing protein 3, mitochondrial n=1 Tax=Brachyhypopomus gauderio TaxID=698409 RepID=UPI0040431358